MRSSKAAALAFATAALLASCSRAPTDSAEPAWRCPQVRDYSPTEEKAITKAMQSLPPDHPLVNAMLDYEELRDQARQCARGERR